MAIKLTTKSTDNPFKKKAKTTSKTNPFSTKAKTKSKGTAEVAPTPKPKPKPKPPKRKKPNAWSLRKERAEKLAQLETMIEEAEERYTRSLDKALKGGVNRAQVKKLFDISDNHMSVLLRLCGQRRHMLNGSDPNKRKRGEHA